MPDEPRPYARRRSSRSDPCRRGIPVRCAERSTVTTQVHASVFHVLAGRRINPTLQEGTAAHRGFEGAGDLHDVLVEDHVRIHALGGAFEGELLQIVVRIARIGVHTMLDGEHELRENGGVMFGTEAADTVQEDGTLNLAGEPVSANRSQRSRTGSGHSTHDWS